MRVATVSSFTLLANKTRSFRNVSKRTDPRIRTARPGFSAANIRLYSSWSRKKAFTVIPSAKSATSKTSKFVSFISRPSTASMTPVTTTFFISFLISSMGIASPATPPPKRHPGAVSPRRLRPLARPFPLRGAATDAPFAAECEAAFCLAAA